ncbi:MAG: type III pantothenate kinase [Rhodothermales bacterium]|jgi:type III pantothenate kinase
MILSVDIGNTATKIGWPEPGRAWMVHRLDTLDLAAELSRFIAGQSAERSDDHSDDHSAEWKVSGVGIASVVPAAVQLVRDAFAPAPIFEVTHTCRLPFAMGYETPTTLGNDRLAAAAGGWLQYAGEGTALLVIDAGTAITYEVIDAAGIYQGGAIGPGPRLLSRALYTGTAQLPELLDLPGQSAIGKSTAEAIRIGVHWAFRESVAGMIRRIRKELQTPLLVVATGGWAADLAAHVAEINLVDPYLVLRGTRQLLDFNAGAG